MIKKKCIICRKEVLLFPSVAKNRSTCGDLTCISKNRSQHRTGKHWDNDFKKRQSVKVKKAYQDGRMKHMSEVWKQNSKAWTGSKNPRWKPIGTKKDDGHGYILIKYRDGFGSKNWKQEHRLVMEKHLGRLLKSGEVVHHINHIKSDNHISNLRLMTSTEHKRFHLKDNLLKV